MDEDLISSSEEVVTYQNLDIVNCAVATTILAADDGEENHGSAVFDYTYEEFYNNQATFHENVAINEEINCKSISKSNFSLVIFNFFLGQEVSTTSSKRLNLTASSQKSSRSSRRKSNYKHVPHCEKPPQVVAKRNARERRRVHAVNQAFLQLRKAIPFENKRGKRVSKVRVLQKAIDYINNLHGMVMDFDGIPYQPNEYTYDHSNLNDSSLFAF